MAENISEVKKIELNEAIIFVLTAFSIILAAIPLLPLQEHETQSSNMIQYFRALDTLNPSNNKTNIVELIKAYAKLREFDKEQIVSNNYFKDHTHNNNQENSSINLEMAKMYYDIDNYNKSISYLRNTINSDKDANLSKWYISRLIDIDNRNWVNEKNMTEDQTCHDVRDRFNDNKSEIDVDTQTGLCTSNELKAIDNNLNRLKKTELEMIYLTTSMIKIPWINLWMNLFQFWKHFMVG